jgi:hypothetical protein
VSDCDEVLMHMVVPFRDWVDEAHGIDFRLDSHDFAGALSYRHDGSLLEPVKIWDLLGGFFDGEMHRQLPIAGAIDAMNALARIADIAILTNLQDERAEARTQQLKAVGLDVPVYTNQGPKGDALARIVARYQPSVTVFIDDLPQHLHSAAQVQPDVWRLHMVGEPLMAAHVKPAPHAHARIDDWADAREWIAEKLNAGAPAPASQMETV